jgi:hypothetical protein
MKTLLTPNTVPPGQWRWTHPETGVELYGANFDALLLAAREYCRKNSLPIGVEFEQRIIDDLCARNPQICSDTEPPTVSEMAATFAGSVKRWVSNGMGVTNFETYHARLSVCKTCDRWNGEALFGLGRCGKCGCSGLKLYMDTEKCPLSKW